MHNTAGTPPVPQANDVAVLATVVDAVADGCDTDAAIAEAIGMSSRQGAYYPNAAATLGLIEAVPGTAEVREWQLTATGADFVGRDAAERCEALAIAILDAEAVAELCEHYVDDGEDAVRAVIEATGVSASTAARRASTIATWVDWALADREDQVPKVADAMTGTRQRTPGVRAALAAARVSTRVVVRHCAGCFVQLPATGVCDNCA